MIIIKMCKLPILYKKHSTYFQVRLTSFLVGDRSNLTDTLCLWVMSWSSLKASAIDSWGRGDKIGPVISGFSSNTNHTSTWPVDDLLLNY